MADASVSVVIVSRHRSDDLMRCLAAVRQQYYSNFEVVVVADPDTISKLETWPDHRDLKILRFDEPNIARARNIGVSHAAGEIVAFVDDDAVPEPTWLSYLTRPLVADAVDASCGFVLGRNGISFQTEAQCVDRESWTRSQHVSRKDYAKPKWPRGFVHKLIGTNTAIRRQILFSLGGFDEAFHFYLDDTDLSLRFAEAGHRSAVVPLAQVHHAFAQSCRRGPDRRPLSLFDVGRSSAIFLRKHSRTAKTEETLSYLRNDQVDRVIRHLVRGNCEPRDVTRTLKTFDHGVEEGLSAELGLSNLEASRDPFRPIPAFAEDDSQPAVLSGRNWSRRKMLREARRVAGKGRRTSVYLFGPTTWYHRVSFHNDGFWLQRGGLFGRSNRSDPWFRLWSFSSRVAREQKRSEPVRQMPPPS